MTEETVKLKVDKQEEKSEPKAEHFEIGKSRIESFSDGVIAIIITLMILNIKVPEIGDDWSGLQIWKQIGTGIPQMFAYILSFTLLGVYWVNHHHFFHALKTTDRHILWWNLNLLFWLSLVPLPTYFLAEHPLKPEAMALYSLNGFAASLSFTLMGRYARAKNLMHDKLSKRRRKRLNRMNWLGISLYFISIFSGYLSVYISYAIFIFVPAMYFIPQKIELED